VLIGAYGSSPRVPAAQTARRLRPCGERGRPEVCRARCSTVISTPFRDGRAPPAGSSPADRCVQRQPSGDHGLCECQGGESLGDGADLERSIGARSRAAGRPQPADARNKRPHHPARRGWPSQLRHGRGRAHRLSAGRAGFALPAGRLSRPPYFLCTACLDTPSTAAISAQDQPAIRARRTTPASRRLAARRSSVAALSAARGSSSPVASTSLATCSTSTSTPPCPSTLVDDISPIGCPRRVDHRGRTRLRRRTR
jgi:hypothetical protein